MDKIPAIHKSLEKEDSNTSRVYYSTNYCINSILKNKTFVFVNCCTKNYQLINILFILLKQGYLILTRNTFVS